MKLPELSPSAQPEFVDDASAKAWLENVPLANVANAQHDILAQLAELNRFPTAAANRLAILEVLREAAHFVQVEQAKRFMNRALPMAQAESAALEVTVDLWEQMRLGYARCLDAATNGEPAMKAQAAMLAQRALAYSGLKMFHYARAYREVPAPDWRALHETYAAAEGLEVAEEAVKDFLNRDVQDSSPRIAYARALLMALANPNELSQRQLTFVAFLHERWANKLDVLREPPPEEEVGAAPLLVDLAGDKPPMRIASPASAGLREPRYLGTAKLAKSLRNRVALLRKGESPAKLALGEDCVQPSCEQLLIFLFRQWCQGRGERGAGRRRSGAPAEATADLAAAHFFLSGRAFSQPGEQKELSKKEREEIATFGRVSTRHEDDAAKGFRLEHWRTEDESAQGLHLARTAGEAGRRYAHNQLLLVRLGDARSFVLGQVRWLMVAGNGDLHAGIKLLPGLPAATAVRPTGLNVQNEKYVPAVSLTAVAALNAPPSLVLPVGWFKPGRVIEVYVDSPVRVRLTALADRGSDFERATYELLS
ncbi:MAG: hypothetical protein ACM30H_12475 [Clostridia bacterium]